MRKTRFLYYNVERMKFLNKEGEEREFTIKQTRAGNSACLRGVFHSAFSGAEPATGYGSWCSSRMSYHILRKQNQERWPENPYRLRNRPGNRHHPRDIYQFPNRQAGISTTNNYNSPIIFILLLHLQRVASGEQESGLVRTGQFDGVVRGKKARRKATKSWTPASSLTAESLI